jgi:hypothetical protein
VNEVMTLPKKYRRNIVVDDHKFHWHFHPYRFGVHSSFICVQDASGTGPLLKIQWVGIALPNHVESAIRFAWETGWDPQGKQILEIGVNSLKEPVTFCIKPADASRHWFYDDFYNRAVREAHIVDPA